MKGRGAVIISFLMVLAIHVVWKSSALEPKTVWVDTAQLSNQTNLSGYTLYVQDKEYFLGLSYALAVAFTVFALSRVKRARSKGLFGLFSGVSISAGLYAFGCFLVGCCGSPMIVVYAGLFGSSFLGFTKPLVFVMTALSIALGYWIMTKKTKSACCSVSDEKGLCKEGM